MDVVVAAPPSGARSDATNYLGGIVDVLQDKGPRGPLPRLGELALVDLFTDDRQIEEISYRLERSESASFTVRLDRLHLDRTHG